MFIHFTYVTIIHVPRTVDPNISSKPLFNEHSMSLLVLHK